MTADQDRLRQHMKRWEIDPSDLAQLLGTTRQGVYRWLADPKDKREYRKIPPVVLRWCEANDAVVDIWNVLQEKRPLDVTIKDIARRYLEKTQHRIDAVDRSDNKRRPSSWKRQKDYMPIRIELNYAAVVDNPDEVFASIETVSGGKPGGPHRVRKVHLMKKRTTLAHARRLAAELAEDARVPVREFRRS